MSGGNWIAGGGSSGGLVVVLGRASTDAIGALGALGERGRQAGGMLRACENREGWMMRDRRGQTPA